MSHTTAAALALALAALAAAIGGSWAAPLTPEATALQISSLPGLAFAPSFDQYAGYISVDAAAGRQLFFWFTEAQSNPDKAPLLLWQTGGPGCSSMYAFFSENGPFYPTSEGYLGNNPWAWNRIANTIFVESPRNVGFSYSTTASDNVVGDAATAADLVTFLQEFVRIFPQYNGRDLWLSGESYGGHYVPTLAKALVQAGTSVSLNLKGFILGNAWTDPATDNLACTEFWAAHGLNSYDASALIVASCNLTEIGPLSRRRSHTYPRVRVQDSGQACIDACTAAFDSWGNISIYDVLVEVGCDLDADGPSQTLLRWHPLYGQRARSSSSDAAKRKRTYDNCGESEFSIYLNNPQVQSAIHATRNGAPVVWEMCSNLLNYSMTDLMTSMLGVYDFLITQTSLQLFVFSGDLDAIVPHIGSQRWIESFNRPVVEAWRPWYDEIGQTGGRVTTYDRITFATVRGAGHEVPMYTPGRAFVLLESVLAGRPLPYYSPLSARDGSTSSGDDNDDDHNGHHGGGIGRGVGVLAVAVALAVGMLVGGGLVGCVALVLSRRRRARPSPHMRLSVFDDED